MSKPPSIYLAGPGVFRPDARAFGDMLKALARVHGVDALYPLDEAVAEDDQATQAQTIFDANTVMIDRADAVVADISPFRGPSLDPGTAFEIGYAHAKGKAIFAWSSDLRTLRERTEAARLTEEAAARDDWAIEDLDLVDNLMIAVPLAGLYGSAEEAIAAAAASLAGQR
jgi:nucleoside 2-deoxyribosyltransferase